MAFQPAFVWGQGGQRMTPEEIARQRQIVDALMGKTDTSPVAHWTQGAARLVDALGTRLDESRLDRAAEQNAETNSSLMSALLGGVSGSSASPGTSSPSVSSALTAGPAETPAGQAINSRIASAHGDYESALPVSFLSAVDSSEGAGAYDTLYGHAQNDVFSGVDVSTMPISEVLAFSDPSGAYAQHVQEQIGRVATPMGRHQIVGTTLRGAVEDLGIDPSTPFSPETQDRIAAHLAQQRIAGQTTMEGKINALRSEWHGFNNVPDSQMVQIVKDLEGGGSSVGAVNAMASGGQGGLPENPSQGQIVRGPDGQLYQNVEQLDGSWDWSRRAENFGAAQQPVQVAQAGGINPAIVQALTSPYADDSTRQMASILLEQQLQANDPAAQLEMEIQREKLNQLRNPGPQELINAGRGRLYDPNTQQWLTAPDMGTDAPTVQTFYDETTGQSYKAQWNPSAGEWERVGGTEAPSGMSLRTNPDGSVEFVQGAGAGQKLTEMQGKDIGFYTRGMDANAQLQELGSELTDFTQQAAGNLPMGIGNYLRDPRFRQAKVAADQFLTALLRKDTGAAIVQSEFEIYGPMFLPMPGDDPDTLRQKERAREVALLAIRSGLGTAEAIGEANRLALGLPEEQLPSFTPSPSGKTSRDGEPTQLETLEIDENTVPEGVDPEDWKYMSEEDRALFR